MTRSIIRSAGSVVVSLVVASLLVLAVEGASAVLHPFPPGFDGTHDQMIEHVARYPGWVLALAAVAWGAIMLISTWLATRLGAGRHPAHGVAVGLLLFSAVVFNMYLLPYPIWFELLNLLLLPIGGYFGVRLGRGEKSAGERDSYPYRVTASGAGDG